MLYVLITLPQESLQGVRSQEDNRLLLCHPGEFMANQVRCTILVILNAYVCLFSITTENPLHGVQIMATRFY